MSSAATATLATAAADRWGQRQGLADAATVQRTSTPMPSADKASAGSGSQLQHPHRQHRRHRTPHHHREEEQQMEVDQAQEQPELLLQQQQQQQCVEPSERYRKRRRLKRTIFGDLVEAVDVSRSRRGVVAKRSLASLMQNHVSSGGIAVLEDPLNEARLLRSLPAHPNVVRYVGEHVEDVTVGSSAQRPDQRHWLVLEKVVGAELFDVVAATNREGLPAVAVHRFFVGLARAIHHLHRHRVAHLDVSLENTLVDEATGEAVLCDFGLARHLPAGGPNTVQFTGVRPGKDTYMAPEIFAGASEYDPFAADVWSLGVSLFMMMAGTPPYEVASLEDRRFELVWTGRLREIIAAWGMADRFSEPLIDLLSRMLCPPEHRATMAEVLQSDWVKGSGPATAA